MAMQSIFEQLATCTIAVNSTALSVVGQSGCAYDDTLSIKEQYANLVKARKGIEAVLSNAPKGWARRPEFLRRLNQINKKQSALRKKYPNEVKRKDQSFDKILIDELQSRVTSGVFQAAYRCAERKFEKE